jgi:hypothetical protein
MKNESGADAWTFSSFVFIRAIRGSLFIRAHPRLSAFICGSNMNGDDVDGAANLTIGGIVSLMLIGIAIGAGFCGLVAVIFAALMAKERRPMERRSMAAGLGDALLRPAALPHEARRWRRVAIVSFALAICCAAGGVLILHPAG